LLGVSDLDGLWIWQMDHSPKGLVKIHDAPDAAAASGIPDEYMGEDLLLRVLPLLGAESLGEGRDEVREGAPISNVVGIRSGDSSGRHGRDPSVSQSEEAEGDLPYHAVHPIKLGLDVYSASFLISQKGLHQTPVQQGRALERAIDASARNDPRGNRGARADVPQQHEEVLLIQGKTAVASRAAWNRPKIGRERLLQK
jgi:hypothetical protein